MEMVKTIEETVLGAYRRVATEENGLDYRIEVKSMIKGLIVNKSKANVKRVAVMAGAENDDGSFKNEVQGYVGEFPVFIKTNLNQHQWNLFCEGKLSKKQIKKCI